MIKTKLKQTWHKMTVVRMVNPASISSMRGSVRKLGICENAPGKYKCKIQKGPIKGRNDVTRNTQTTGIEYLTSIYLHNIILAVIWKGPNICILIVIYQTYVHSHFQVGLPAHPKVGSQQLLLAPFLKPGPWLPIITPACLE